LAASYLQVALLQDVPVGVRRVTIPPLITSEPPKMLAFREGESIEMPCVATGQPDPKYIWQMNGKDFDPSGNDARIAIQPGVGTLIFSNPILRDEGIYQCLAENGVGVAVTIKIDLRVAILEPFPSSSPRMYDPLLGAPLTLACVKPRSFPAPDVFWSVLVENQRYTPVSLSDRISIDPEGNLHFANVIADDAFDNKVYACIVQNKVMRRFQDGSYAQIRPQGQLEQRHPPKSVWIDPHFQVALVGETWRVKCIFSGYPTPRVTWDREGKPMPPRTKEESFGQELVIENVQAADMGKYECMGINDDTTVPVRYSFDLVIESAPFWSEKPESIDAAENDTAVFHCQATGNPEPIISWFINGIPISKVPANERRTVEPNKITYRDVVKDDACVIQCNATNKHGYIFTNAYLNVLSEPPVITEQPVVGMRAAEGQTVNLTCQVFGSPKPVVVWKKSGEQLTGGRFSVTADGHLQIAELSLVDAGSYTCSATNKFGSVSATGSLVVRRKTIIQMEPVDVMVFEGTEAKFTCTASTDPEEVPNLDIQWKKDDELIDYRLAQRMFKNYMDNSLTISGTITLDTGKYTCVASNGLDTDESDAMLIVQGAPDPPTNLEVRCRQQEKVAEVEWQPGKENYAPILNFIIQFNTSFAPDTWIDIVGNLTQNTRRYDVRLSPYGNYTFRVLARNKIGLSMPSIHTSPVCKTEPETPQKNPENVIVEGDYPNELVVYWTPMPPIEWNGPDLKYVINWERINLEPGETPNTGTTQIELPDVYHMVIPKDKGSHGIYKPYKVTVKAKNTVGDSRVPADPVIGYSGEDTPLDAPTDIVFDPESLGKTSVLLTWPQVDTDPKRIRGYFRGYRIQFWKTAEGESLMREKDLILNVTTPYPRPRVKRAATIIEYELTNLPPYAEITVQIRVLNKYYAGAPSAPVIFTTLEGEPGPPAAFDVLARGPTHFDLIWEKPLQPNGILKGYNISYQSITGLNLGRLKYREPIQDPEATRAKLTGLVPEMEYRIYLSAATRLGKGEEIFLDAKTTPAGPPSPPTFDIIEVDEEWAILQWEPSRTGSPGSVFYVQYRARGSFLWLNGADESLHYRANISDIDPGTTYQIRVVAKNGEGYEAASEWQEFTTGGIAPGRMFLGVSGWFYGIWASLLIIILGVILFYFLKKKRDVWWEKKEGEIAEAMLQLQAEDAVRQLGIENQYHMGSREMLQSDMSHASMPGSEFKAPVDDIADEEDDDDDDDDDDDETESEEEDEGGFSSHNKSKEAYGGAGYPRKPYTDQADPYKPPEYGNLPVGGQTYHPGYSDDQPPNVAYQGRSGSQGGAYPLGGPQSGQGSTFI